MKPRHQTSNDVRRRHRVARLATISALVATVPVFAHPNSFSLVRLSHFSGATLPAPRGGARIDCDDGNPCTIDSLDPETSECIHTPVNCDDAIPCTDDSCDPQTGQCIHTPVNCDDAVPCTDDSCDPQTGQCIHTATNCDDSDPCTIDACDSKTGQCVHTPQNCDDSDPCTTDSCSGGSCVHNNDDDDDGTTNCNDQCPNTQAGAVANAQGCSCEQVNCDDGDVCTTDSCSGGICVHDNDEDDDGVTNCADQCPNSPGGAPINAQGCSCGQFICDDGDACTIDTCNPQTVQCVHTPQDCNDSDPCTTDSCGDGVCVHDNDDDDDGVTNCDDQCPNTPNGAPINVQGCACEQLNCNDSNPCTIDTCIPETAQCVHTPQTCDDSDPCTTDSCGDGSCVHDDDDDDDGVTNCNDQCPNTPASTVVNVQGCACAQISCDDGDPCTTDQCGGGGCVHDDDDDDDGVTNCADQCPNTPGGAPINAQGCACEQLDCDDDNPCTIDTCNPQTAECVHSPVNCDDGNPCTTDSCDSQTGQCVHTPVSCDDGNPNTVDACEPQNGNCSHTPVNIVFMICDDLNDAVGYLGARPGILTPNIDALSTRGVWFTKAWVSAPTCNPSRASMLTSLRASTSGVYGNNSPWQYALRNLTTLPQHFSANGYRTIAVGGKVFHFPDPSSWNETYDCSSNPQPPVIPAHGIAGLGYLDWAPLSNPDSDMGDARAATYAAQYLSQSHSQPFFMAVGFSKPHAPWYVPQQYFDMYPLNDIILPNINPNDLLDLPPAGNQIVNQPSNYYNLIQANNALPDLVRAYYASVSFVDAQLGVVMNALNNGPNAANTLVVFVSDNGFHLGEKRYIGKYTLWQESNRVPLIMAGPGVTPVGQSCDRAVSLLDLAPTILDVAGLPPLTGREGASFATLLDNPSAPWERAPVSTWGQNQHCVRTDRWLYIRYPNGNQELYDHDTDPHEWYNLAGFPGYDAIKAELAARLPATSAPTCPSPPSIMRVKSDATGNGDGASWTNAMPDLNKALAIANATYGYGTAFNVREIWVARGTYKPVGPGGSREKSFSLFRGATLFGGFAGNELYRYQRAPQLHPTILSGDLNGNDGPAPANRADNSYHVVKFVDTVSTSVFDGFVVTGGHADAPSPDNRGGGAYLDHALPSIFNCWFVDNHADYGGAIYCDGGSNSITAPLIFNTVLVANSATVKGGAIHCDPSTAELSACRFGAVGGPRPVITNCTVVGNTAATGGGLTSTETYFPTIKNSIFWQNVDSSGSGQAAQISGNFPLARFCDIQGFTGTGLGGGVGNIGTNPLFVDPVGPDGVAYSGDEDLRLFAGSPCIDSGKNNDVPSDWADLDEDLNLSESFPWDLSGTTRMLDDPYTSDTGVGVGPIVDIGAFEFIVTDPCGDAFDANRDGAVNGQDVQVLVDCLLNGFSPVADCTCSDVNDDGVVSMVDVDSLADELMGH